MKHLKEEARRHHSAKLHKYGGKAHASGGTARHPDEKEDEALIKKEVKPGCLKHPPHKAGGGPVGGGPSPVLGRHRYGAKGGKKMGRTNIGINIGKTDPGPGIMPMPGAGPAVAAPMAARPPMPVMPPRPPVAAPPPGAGPMRHGGAAHKRREHHRGHHGKGH